VAMRHAIWLADKNGLLQRKVCDNPSNTKLARFNDGGTDGDGRGIDRPAGLYRQLSSTLENMGVSFINAIMTLIAFLPVLVTLSAHVPNLPIIGHIP
ncbi:hypothetical protein MJN85_27260, partial [Salmonella enterica subsp. enterica serovar Anatum]|nr:hypothetical protein [Salmonella enterica subsp. enterica serovar Anatum]